MIEISPESMFERESNFFHGEKFSINNFEEVRPFYQKAYEVRNSVMDYIESNKEKRKAEIIDGIFDSIYNFTFSSDNRIPLSPQIIEKLRNAVCYIGICVFLVHSKKVQRISMRELTQNYSLDFRDRIDSNNIMSTAYINELELEEDSLKKYRNKLFRDRSVFIDYEKNSAIPVFLEQEWSAYFYFKNNDDDEISKINKRYKNLLTDIRNLQNHNNDPKYDDIKAKAKEKFLSKLNKFSYSNYLTLGKFFLDRINQGPQKYRGINAYNLEKQLGLYAFSYETTFIEQVMDLEEEEEEDNALVKELLIYEIKYKFCILQDICFPPLIDEIPTLSLEEAFILRDLYLKYREKYSLISRLIIDELIEEEFFQEDWEDYLHCYLSSNARTIFDYEKIDLYSNDTRENIFKMIMRYNVETVIQ